MPNLSLNLFGNYPKLPKNGKLTKQRLKFTNFISTESPRDQEHSSTLTLVQQLLWWPKTRSNRWSNLFSPYLSNVEESAKNDHGNEFKGSKNGETEVWVGLEWPENSKIRRPTVAAAVAFTGPIWVRPTAVDREFLLARSPRCDPPP